MNYVSSESESDVDSTKWYLHEVDRKSKNLPIFLGEGHG